MVTGHLDGHQVYTHFLLLSALLQSYALEPPLESWAWQAKNSIGPMTEVFGLGADKKVENILLMGGEEWGWKLRKWLHMLGNMEKQHIVVTESQSWSEVT